MNRITWFVQYDNLAILEDTQAKLMLDQRYMELIAKSADNFIRRLNARRDLALLKAASADAKAVAGASANTSAGVICARTSA